MFLLRLLLTCRISRIAAPEGLVTTPIVLGKAGSSCFLSESKSPNDNRIGTKKMTMNPEIEKTDNQKIIKKKTVKFHDNINWNRLWSNEGRKRI